MFLGIDLGTSQVKALLLDERHRIIATAAEALEISRPRHSWSEQDPADWWTATDRAMRSLARCNAGAMSAVQAIGLSGQMHGAVLLDARGEVLRPAILWNDGRSHAECIEIEAAIPQLHSIAGNIAMPGFTAPKLWWVRKHEPDIFARTAGVLLPKDWLRWRMTGERVSDLSDASGTLWLDTGSRRWSSQLLEASGLSLAHMPTLVEGSEPAGVLRRQVAARWGLRPGIRVAGGGGDNAASAVGVGAVRPNEGFVSLGTSGVIFISNEAYRPRPASAVHTYCHALPATWHQMSVMLSAGSALRWVCRMLNTEETPLLERIAQMQEAELRDAPLFLPYLDGERTPHNDPNAKGVLFGLNGEHGPVAVGYAVIEGVAFGLLDGWTALATPAGSVRSLSLVGGGARSGVWAQLLASALGVRLQTGKGAEAGAALGAARLAWLAAGGDISEVCQPMPTLAVFDPDPAVGARLARRAERFRSLYPTLRKVFTSS